MKSSKGGNWLVTGGPDLLPDCSNYDRDKYDKAANTVDTAIVRLRNGALEVLLIKRKWEPFQGMWALPGGFVKISDEENLEDSSLRELKEETGAEGVQVRELGTYGDPERDPRDRVISTVFFALIGDDVLDYDKLKAADDAEDHKWEPLRKAMTSELGFDHTRILSDLCERLEQQVQYLPLAFDLVPKLFTWPQIEEAYSAILNRPIPNVRRKLNSRYTIKIVGKEEASVSKRPAYLLEFRGEKYKF